MNYRSIIIIGIGVVIGMSVAMPNIFGASAKEVRIANFSGKPYYEEELPNYGLIQEIITTACARKGYSVTYAFRPWARVLFEVEKGKFDAAAAYYTEERARIYVFSDNEGFEEIRWNGTLQEILEKYGKAK
jgi:polar amino acid transport system substrate-binding protein